MKKILLLTITICLNLVGVASSVDTVAIFSKAMNKNLKCVVIKPDNYRNKDLRFPVVFLLHGYQDSYEYWIKEIPAVVNYADKFQVLIVCPDGDRESWYFDSPRDSSIRIETHISKEVVHFVDSSYRTIADKYHRAISGMSMGGHGALFIALRHSDIFGAAGSSSGVVNLVPFRQNSGLMHQLGDTSNRVPYQQYSVLNIIDNYVPESVSIIFDCGSDDPFLRMNNRLHEKMLRLNISHEYLELPGAHTNEYWGTAIQNHFVFFQKYFQKPK